MKPKNSYWRKRFKSLEDEEYQRSAEYYKDLQEQFRQAKKSIQTDIERWYQRMADNNDISLAAAKRLLKKDELEEFHWTVEQYIKKGEENAVNQRWMKQLENASARHHISYLEAMKLQIQQHEELLFTEYESGVTDFLQKSYAENYYHTAYEIAKGTSVGSNLAVLDERRIDKVLKKPWALDGANFSDRIWANKQKLVNNLHTELSQSIIRGEDPQKAINRLAHTMDVSKAQAGRLIMTESAAIASAAQKDCFNELGVEQYEIVAAFDSITCSTCQKMDGKVFGMKDFEVGLTAPPFHPNCRCCEVPYFDDEFTAGGERAARGADGKTYYVPADMKYKDWKEKYVGKPEKKNEETQIKTERNLEYKVLTEDEYDNLIEKHRKNVDKNERSSVMGFDWDNFRPMNEEYGYINTDNSQNINAVMRKNAVESLPQQSQQTIKDLKNIISRNTIDTNALARRHVDYNWLVDKFGNVTDIEKAVRQAIADEKVITDNQFVSASLTDQISYSDRFVQIIFQVPSGCHAYVTENRMESEVIFYRPSYKPKSVDKVITPDGHEQLVIICEMEV